MAKTMTKEEISSALPLQFRGKVSTKLVNEINNIIQTTELGDCYKEQFMWFGNILADSRFSLSNYVNAVKYVSLKSLGHTNASAWGATFPDRFRRLKAMGKTNKEIHNHVRSYSGTALVTKMLAQAMVPAWLVNQHNFQDAINVQVDLMHNAKSETVRCNAANSIIQNLNKPEVQEIEMTHNVVTDNEASAIEVYKKAAKELAQAQLKALKNGVTLDVIANSKIVQEEKEDV